MKYSIADRTDDLKVLRWLNLTALPISKRRLPKWDDIVSIELENL